MIARDVMTRDVVSVTPDTSVRTMASLLLKHRISAVPVIDATSAPIGMVSEGDLIGRKEAESEAREDWWLTLLAEQALCPGRGRNWPDTFPV
jgi:CBS-domain-containing membrane protein